MTVGLLLQYTQILLFEYMTLPKKFGWDLAFLIGDSYKVYNSPVHLTDFFLQELMAGSLFGEFLRLKKLLRLRLEIQRLRREMKEFFS